MLCTASWFSPPPLSVPFSYPMALGSCLTLLSPIWSSGPRLVFYQWKPLFTAPQLWASMVWDHEGNTEPICPLAIGELARATGTVMVTSASLWHSGLCCLCSAVPEGKGGRGGVKFGIPKAIYKPRWVCQSSEQSCCDPALSPGPVPCGWPGSALQITRERSIQNLISGRELVVPGMLSL